jgi:hypothetical protein
MYDSVRQIGNNFVSAATPFGGKPFMKACRPSSDPNYTHTHGFGRLLRT